MKQTVGFGARLAFVLATVSGLAAPLSAQTAAPIVLRPGDALRVEVKNEPALAGQFGVTAAGTVMLPLVGLVRVADRPIEEVIAELEEAYGRELADPEFLATPLVRVKVTGEVRAPGLHWADPTMTLSDVLVLAGGPLPTAKQHRVDLVRGGSTRELDVQPGSLALDIAPLSGDELLVPRRSWIADNLPILIGAAASVAAAAVTSLIVR